MESIFKWRLIFLKSFLAFLLITLFSSLLFAQAPPAASTSKPDDPIIACTFGYVSVVGVKVTDSRGNEVVGLRMKDFIVFEDGVQQEIESFRLIQDDDPKSIKVRFEIGYMAPGLFDGSYRNIRIALKNRANRHLKIKFTPNGYFANRDLLK